MRGSIKKNYKVYLYLAPALILITIFVIYPIFNSIWLSFHDKKMNLSLDTYTYVLKNAKFRMAVSHTLIYALIATPITIVISLFVSFLMSQKIKMKNFYQTVYFLPYVTSTIAIGAVWRYMLHTDYGLVNMVLNELGLPSIGWLSNPNFALTSVIIFGIWKALAFNILLLFTALTSVDETIEKAALIDGSSALKTFIKIKLPQVYPVLSYLIIIGLIHSLKVYEEVVSLFQATSGIAGPSNSAITLVFYIQSNLTTDKTVASVAAVILLVITLVLTMLNRLVGKYIFGGRV